MIISELIKYLEDIKQKEWDLICTSERYSCVWKGLLTEKNVSVYWLTRPTWRTKIYKLDYFGNGDLKTLAFWRTLIDDVE